ncbi:hypothetical protein KQY30_26335 [Streptomyces sp. GMY02]|uniref:hypothetical protein n=1 Tax=Streptomyces sp. GMY02 TaxID=1333528 RepID=UPI001C2C99E1|nr:hypothetical protein [Streptomyces sp. GMY02]QXE37211.1 hypothetical protein KQY30_26335 [Streptomyces sp. GMY02]
MGGTRRGHIRSTRPTALVSAVATLYAALFICLAPGAGSAVDPGRGTAGGHGRNGSPAAVSTAAKTGAGSSAGRAGTVRHHAEARFTCPYDGGDCGLFAHHSPAVLTVPPPAPPLAAGVQLQPRALPYPTGQAPRSGAHARAPDLHVLQVLRT